MSHGPLRPNSLHSSRDSWWNIEQGIDRLPEIDTSPYRSDCADNFRRAQDRTIESSDPTGSQERERIRQLAAPLLRSKPAGVEKWAFRITVGRMGRRSFDLENVVKPIVDAFCDKQIQADKSHYQDLGLYSDDTLDHVVLLEIAGSRTVVK